MNDEAIALLINRLREGAGLFLERLPLILRSPKAYPRESMLLALMVVLVLVFIVLFGFAMMDIISAYQERRRLGLVSTPRKRIARIAAFVSVSTLLLLAIWLAPMTVPASDVCGSCHVTRKAHATWTKSTHRGVACYDCHAGPGVARALAASARGSGNVFKNIAGVRALDADAVIVDPHSCVACHQEIIHHDVGLRVTMRHSDVIEAGVDCAECHEGIGHVITEKAAKAGDLTGIKRSVMSVCLTCHDGRKAPADCDACHAGKPLDDMARAAGGQKTDVNLTCRGCHSADVEKRCIGCHGLELPHPIQFKRGHAGISWKQPALCAKCHEEARSLNGCGCHTEENTHGTYAQWFPRHGPQAARAGRYGCNCHQISFCTMCHEANPFGG